MSPLGRPRRRWWNDIKRSYVMRHKVVDGIYMPHVGINGGSEHGNGLLGSVKCYLCFD